MISDDKLRGGGPLSCYSIVERLVNSKSMTTKRINSTPAGQISAWLSCIKQATRFNWITPEESKNAVAEILSLRRSSRGRTSTDLSRQSGS